MKQHHFVPSPHQFVFSSLVNAHIIRLYSSRPHLSYIAAAADAAAALTK